MAMACLQTHAEPWADGHGDCMQLVCGDAGLLQRFLYCPVH